MGHRGRPPGARRKGMASPPQPPDQLQAAGRLSKVLRLTQSSQLRMRLVREALFSQLPAQCLAHIEGIQEIIAEYINSHFAMGK